MRYRFSKEMYTKEALIKAAYHYTDRAYLHLDADEEAYIVDIEAKEAGDTITEQEFCNAILAETVRIIVAEKTKNVRELILARAFSSTIIDEKEDEEPQTEDYRIDEILTDWFEAYEDEE